MISSIIPLSFVLWNLENVERKGKNYKTMKIWRKETLQKICEKTGFSRIGTESRILSLYGKIRVTENLKEDIKLIT